MPRPLFIALFAILALCNSYWVAAQSKTKIPGRIYFVDGTTKSFSTIKYIGAIMNEGIGALAGLSTHDVIPVRYDNSVRALPYDKLESFEILSYGWTPHKDMWLNIDGYELCDVRVRVETVTGVVFETTYDKILTLGVEIHDELTGEHIEQIYNFGTLSKTIPGESKLLIKKIVLEHS
jgi:hypothetical protein